MNDTSFVVSASFRLSKVKALVYWEKHLNKWATDALMTWIAAKTCVTNDHGIVDHVGAAIVLVIEFKITHYNNLFFSANTNKDKFIWFK